LNIKKTDSSIFEHPYASFISILIITTLIALFNSPIMTTLWRYSFDDGTYSHAFLIPFIVGYLFYIVTSANKLIFRVKFSWFATVMFLLSSYILFVASSAQISLLYWFATILLLCTAINLVFISNLKIFFPALYFVFLIPVWGVLTIPLQYISIFAVNVMMGFTNIPVFVEQEFVQIPSGVFEIAGGCSGLRYLLTSLAISSLFSFLYLRTTKNTIIFIAVAIFGALLTNWLRISALIVIGHQTEMTSSLMDDHNMFGWYLYIPFMLLLFKLGGYLSDNEVRTNKITAQTKKTNTINWKIAAVLFAGLLLSSTSLTMPDSATTKPVSASVQPVIYYYSSVDIVSNDAKTTHLIYNFNGNHLEVKPTFFENNFIPDGWQLIAKNITNESQTIKIKKGLETAVVTVHYEIAGVVTGGSAKFKLMRLKQALIGIKNTKLHWQFQLN